MAVMKCIAVAAAALAILMPYGLARAGDSDAAQVARGEYLVRIGDCAGCHTARGGEPFAGGRAIPTPFGTIYTSNITPDEATGIGHWQPEDFRAAMRQGIAPGGRLLYPAFPFTSYTHASDEDVDAIYAYLRTLSAVAQSNRAPELRFPYSLRPLLMAWRAMYFPESTWQPDATKSDAWNRGAYLVEGLGHCNECHAPRNRLGAMLRDRALSGAVIPGQDWYAPNLHPDTGGLQGWSEEDISQFLQTGRSRHGSAYGPMAEVVQQSLQYLSDADAQAIAIYLLDAPQNTAERVAPTELVPPVTQSRNLVDEGAHLYRQQCADCHGDDGAGMGLVYPPLAGNSAVLGAEVNVIRAVLLGGFQPATAANPRPYSMPPFAPRFDDRETAAVVSYIRQAWGNRAEAVSPSSVARYRSVPAR